MEMSKEAKPRNSESVQSAKEFVAGCLCGIAQVFIGQPFDIVKVRLQTQGTGSAAHYTGTLDAVKKILAQEGPLAFYKGSVAPLAGVGAAVSIQFGVVEKTKRFFQNMLGNPKELPMNYVFWSGSVAGIANSIVSISAEHIRIRNQIQKAEPGKPLEYSGSLDCAKKIYNKHGLAGIYKGTMVTLAREFVSYGAYFATYEYLLRSLRKPGQKSAPMSHCLMAGAMAGYAYWLSIYPIDVVKTMFQSQSLDKPIYHSSIDCARQLFKAQGIKGFFNGITPCILRAGPTNAGGFLVFETIMKMLGSNKHE